jgi:hypothetical protein
MPVKHVVKDGETVPAIAQRRGFLADTIWNDPANAALKTKRGNMNVLKAGDELTIPDRRKREESVPTDAPQKFTRKADKQKFKVVMMAGGKARAGEDYVLQIGELMKRGKTDGGGKIEVDIPATARNGTLSFKEGKERYQLILGGLDPVDEVSGVQQRLNNLGFRCGQCGQLDESTKQALRKFQTTHELPVTGEADGATKAKLKSFFP